MTRPRLVVILYTLTSILLGILIHPLFFTMLIATFLVLAIDLIACDFRYASTCPIGFFRKLKRVYTSDGRFYIYFHHGYKSCHLFQDKLFFLKGITYNNYASNEEGEIDIEPVKAWVKSQVDSIYKKKRYARKLNASVSQWNGHIDKQVERDVKIDKVLN